MLSSIWLCPPLIDHSCYSPNHCFGNYFVDKETPQTKKKHKLTEESENTTLSHWPLYETVTLVSASPPHRAVPLALVPFPKFFYFIAGGGNYHKWLIHTVNLVNTNSCSANKYYTKSDLLMTDPMWRVAGWVALTAKADLATDASVCVWGVIVQSVNHASIQIAFWKQFGGRRTDAK